MAAFLVVLLLMDTFRLVRPASTASAIAWGAVAAIVSLWLNQQIIDRLMPAALVSRYVAPLTEEAAKSAFIVALMMTARIGFLVDAAISGFATGTGFALVENIVYLESIPEAGPVVWIVRGLGTAMLQGATTAIFAIVSRSILDRQRNRLALALAPGLAAAIVIHSAFNHRLLPPMAQTLALLIALPLLVLLVFQRSEQATRDWIGPGLDLDVELLNLVKSEAFASTRFGRYLHELRTRMPGPVVADMFCLLRLELELSAQAKALLLARDGGIDLPRDDDLGHALSERDYLQQSIGTVGLLALKPLQVTGHRDRWHRHLLRRR